MRVESKPWRERKKKVGKGKGKEGWDRRGGRKMERKVEELVVRA